MLRTHPHPHPQEQLQSRWPWSLLVAIPEHERAITSLPEHRTPRTCPRSIFRAATDQDFRSFGLAVLPVLHCPWLPGPAAPCVHKRQTEDHGYWSAQRPGPELLPLRVPPSNPGRCPHQSGHASGTDGAVTARHRSRPSPLYTALRNARARLRKETRRCLCPGNCGSSSSSSGSRHLPRCIGAKRSPRQNRRSARASFRCRHRSRPALRECTFERVRLRRASYSILAFAPSVPAMRGTRIEAPRKQAGGQWVAPVARCIFWL